MMAQFNLLENPYRGNRISDDGDAARRWAVAGHGITYKSALAVAEDLSAWQLIRLCPAFAGDPAPLHLLCADRRQISPLVNSLRDFREGRYAKLSANIHH